MTSFIVTEITIVSLNDEVDVLISSVSSSPYLDLQIRNLSRLVRLLDQHGKGQ